MAHVPTFCQILQKPFKTFSHNPVNKQTQRQLNNLLGTVNLTTSAACYCHAGLVDI